MTADPQPDVEVAQAPPPRHWEADVLLRDGRTAHIRPIGPADADLLVEFYSRVSDRSKYYRFFSPMPHLSERDVRRFTQVDHDGRVAFVVLLRNRMIAVGRYDVIPDKDHPDDRPPPRWRSSSRTSTTAGASRSCCWSTSRRPRASAGSSGSPPRCCPTTTG